MTMTGMRDKNDLADLLQPAPLQPDIVLAAAAAGHCQAPHLVACNWQSDGEFEWSNENSQIKLFFRPWSSDSLLIIS